MVFLVLSFSYIMTHEIVAPSKPYQGARKPRFILHAAAKTSLSTSKERCIERDKPEVKETYPIAMENNITAMASSWELAPRLSIREIKITSRQAEVDLDFDQNNPENPRTSSKGKKAFITFAILISTFITYVQTHTILVTYRHYSVKERMNGILTEAKNHRNSHLHRHQA